MRLGHEWAGTVTAVGDGVDPGWVGRRVTGDTMLGDGTCRRCRAAHQHVCEHRQEVGIRGGRPGALAEQLAVPASSLHALPDAVDAVLGALVEPGGNALRAAAAAAALGPVTGRWCSGPGTIGLLVAMFARAAGAEVHLMGRSDESLDVRPLPRVRPRLDRGHPAATCRSTRSSTPPTPRSCPRWPSTWSSPPAAWSTSASPATPSRIDTRTLALKDVTAVGILSASPGLAARSPAYAARSGRPAAAGRRDGRPRPRSAPCSPASGRRAPVPGPKIHVDPRLS